MTSLLPSNSTLLERALEATNSSDTATMLRTLYNPVSYTHLTLPTIYSV